MWMADPQCCLSPLCYWPVFCVIYSGNCFRYINMILADHYFKGDFERYMLYFIPAWYQQNQWCENEQIWYERRMYTEFDDTVKQIQLFHRSKVCQYQIILLGYAPNFRHFLHRQSVYRAPYWSCFVAIQ